MFKKAGKADLGYHAPALPAYGRSVKIAKCERLLTYMRNLHLATLIATTSVFSGLAYRICALWTKFFVLAHAETYIEAFQNANEIFGIQESKK